jgi:hypothetical protein
LTTLTKNSQTLGTKPSELTEGQFLEVEHAGMFYQFCHDYGHLDLVIGKLRADGENVVAIRFNENKTGLDPVHADAFWLQLMQQMEQIQDV